MSNLKKFLLPIIVIAVAGYGGCSNAASLLAVDVERIMAQAVSEATARGTPATIAVVDRVGNVLGVFRMTGALPSETALLSVTISSKRYVTGGLEDVSIPASLAAIAKAITAAYLSSEGNAFTTRTANQIVQENFNPGENNRPSGPLFGVQFSNLPCSDINRRFGDGTLLLGPKRSPLGLSADPGGLPLYKNGALVGGVGVVADNVYGLDLVISDMDRSGDESIASAGATGYSAPLDRRANRITVDGKSLRFTDSTRLVSNPLLAPNFTAITITGPRRGELIAVAGYTAAAITPGVALGNPTSGIRRAPINDYDGLTAYILVDADDFNLYPPIPGTDNDLAQSLAQTEVTQILTEGLRIASRARSQIRRPLSTAARVNIAVVDTRGVVLGLVRSPDAPVFGVDVAVQKARTAAFFSGAHAAGDLLTTPAANYRVPAAPGTTSPISAYVTATHPFLGAIAFSNRAIGNLARPYFPDGITNTTNGPLSKPFQNWSPFSDGLQLDLVLNRVVRHVGFVASNGAPAMPDTPARCTERPADIAPGVAPGVNRLANGIQIFPGSVPIYRGSTLVGGVGVSGDGVDQDDMVAFLGLHNAGRLGTIGNAIGNAPRTLRADTLTPLGVRLRYVQCPQAPFINSRAQNVCEGL